jgi:hypothetical protein
MKKDPMMILFSKEWFKLKQMMEITVAVLKEKGYPDILYEEIIWNVEVPGSSRTKQFRHGFKISFGRKTSKKELAKVYEALHKELNERGRISLVDGE